MPGSMSTLGYPCIEEFEIFSGDTFELTKSLRRRTKLHKPGSFIVRHTKASNLQMTGEDELRAALTQVDAYFDIIAGSIGGTVVRHSWMLIPVRDFYPGLSDFGYPRLRLGAEVEVQDGVEMVGSITKSEEDAMLYALHDAAEDFRLDNGWFIYDAAQPFQFMNTSVGPVLVDIDPLIRD